MVRCTSVVHCRGDVAAGWVLQQHVMRVMAAKRSEMSADDLAQRRQLGARWTRCEPSSHRGRAGRQRGCERGMDRADCVLLVVFWPECFGPKCMFEGLGPDAEQSYVWACVG